MARGILREDMVTVPRIDGNIRVRMTWTETGLAIEGEPVWMIQTQEVFNAEDGTQLDSRELTQWESRVATSIARAYDKPVEEWPREVVLTLHRPDQDITVALWRQFWRGEWESHIMWVSTVSGQREYLLWGLDEDGNQVQITDLEALSLIERAQAGEDETGR